MPKRPPARDQGKLREDANETAFRVLQQATGEQPRTPPPSERTDEQKNPEAVKRGRKGGKKGGMARSDSLTPEQRSEIAHKAATKRWNPNP